MSPRSKSRGSHGLTASHPSGGKSWKLRTIVVANMNILSRAKLSPRHARRPALKGIKLK